MSLQCFALSIPLFIPKTESAGDNSPCEAGNADSEFRNKQLIFQKIKIS